MEKNCAFNVPISQEDVSTFAKLSGDYNPLHTDAAYARGTDFGRPVVHGAFLIGLVSRVLGMHIPGERSLILSINTQFPKPLYYPATVRVEGQLKHFNPQRRTGSVHVTIMDPAKQWCVLKAEVSFALHDRLKKIADSPPPEKETKAKARRAGSDGARPRLLVTGGTGGLGKEILPLLSKHFFIDCLSRTAEAGAAVRYRRVDLEEAGAFESFLREVSPGEFFGVVHMSAPPMPRAFVSDDLNAARRHWRHAVEIPLLAAHWARGPRSAVKRIVLMGSNAGTPYPRPHFGPYSLGKAGMEHLVKLLPYDLAAQGATVNMVLPSAVPVGLNEGMPERARKALEGKMPTGRLVNPHDIAHTLLFLLSEEAGQINGTALTVDGGFLEHV